MRASREWTDSSCRYCTVLSALYSPLSSCATLIARAVDSPLHSSGPLLQVMIILAPPSSDVRTQSSLDAAPCGFRFVLLGSGRMVELFVQRGTCNYAMPAPATSAPIFPHTPFPLSFLSLSLAAACRHANIPHAPHPPHAISPLCSDTNTT